MTTKSSTSTTDTNWQIETLLKRAFERTKERFLSFFLINVMLWGIIIAFMIVSILIGVILGFVGYGVMHNAGIVVLVEVVLSLVALGVVIYLSAWFSLAMVDVIMEEKKPGISQSLTKVKPLIWGYFRVQIVFMLFIMGLLPLIGLSIGIIGLLWGFWASFLAFSYLEKPRNGLGNLWHSRALVNQKFWPIVGRMLLMTLIMVVLTVIFGLSRNSALRSLNIIISFFATPFILSYNYEMYKLLPDVSEVKRPTGWILLSVIGGVAMIALSILGIGGAVNALPGIMKDYQRQHPSQYRNMPGYRAPATPTDNSYQL